MEIIIVVVVAIIVVVIVALIASSGGGKSNDQWKSVLKTNVYKAEANSRSNNYTEVKDSLVELDKLVDYMLQSKRVQGDTLGERLKNAKNLFSHKDYNALWSAHKLRNTLVHEVGSTVSVHEIKSHSTALASIIKKSI